VKIEAMVTPELLEAATAAVMTAARTDSVADGTVLIVRVDDAVSIGIRKHGPRAL
jgi:nitrogen regulatory protein PII